MPLRIKGLWRRVRTSLFGANGEEVDEELSYHIARQTELHVAAGMTQEEARRQAPIAFGGIEKTREQCHEERTAAPLESVLRDVRYAFRGLRRAPAFAIAGVLTFAVGIGATTAVFSVVDRLTVSPSAVCLIAMHHDSYRSDLLPPSNHRNSCWVIATTNGRIIRRPSRH